MARARSLVAPIALLGALGCIFVPRLAAFVAPSKPVVVPRWQLRRRVGLAATAADIEVTQAEKKASLMAWAAEKLQSEGRPQAAEMQAQAARALQEYESLKAALEQGSPAAAPAPAPAAAAAAATTAVPTAQELEELKKEADLLAWAAKDLAESGAPQAAEMRARAEQAVDAYDSERILAQLRSPSASGPSSSLTAGDIELIRATWAIVETLPAETVGVLLFKNIFRLAGDGAESVSKLFSFSREQGFSLDRLDDSAGLKPHGTKVVSTVSAAVSLLEQADQLVPVLVSLGRRHGTYGTAAAHYPVVGGALLATLEQGLPKEKYTPEAQAAFGKMWDLVATVMQSSSSKL